MKWIHVFLLLLFCTKFSQSKTETDFFTGISTLLQSRIKRDDHYDVKCHQSGTGLFSFFAVPILLGDITIDFMQMIDVMVDIMATATGTGTGNNNNNNNNNNNGDGGGGGDGGGDAEGGNNNNNNNNNNNGRKRRSLESEKISVIQSALEAFEFQPSNNSIIDQYQSLAKNHIEEYLVLLDKDPGEMAETEGLIGPRHWKRPSKKGLKSQVVLNFLQHLMSSYHQFKHYCQEIDYKDTDCAILDTDWQKIINKL